ncbi:bifunctional UDP-sugar hydrolase/5'-nucleotidase [Dysgonomonas sp. 520]|uniref:bifunctional metallophosphatase/5'-nucleotidase n=1 Tax=Dysgonomonas sp. 520 TaxID=2302931 RepID=UPI0013CF4A45|nr:metallophosphoesterase [Dysgonomonas sp. 520]NDW08139.1 bifunctional metallophosphatase/5'-nucleotidase [Dysgonomonas sp. 520]
MKASKNIFALLFLLTVLTGTISAQKNIVIIHTNDTHSRIEPMPKTDKEYPDKGGVIRRADYIGQIRKENSKALLLDAGDFVQGTPYFNLFKGRVEAQAMSLLKYDAGTLGNHEFDYGLDTLKRIIQGLSFPIVNCNYDFSNTVLRGLVKPYITMKRDGVKIGIIGVGIDPEGLIEKNKYEGMVFNPIISSANKYSQILKEKEKCDLIICLSHIGYDTKEVNDIRLAQETEYIDIIIGGHSHTYMEKPDIRKNLSGKDVMIFQQGKNGSYIGRIDVVLDKIN